MALAAGLAGCSATASDGGPIVLSGYGSLQAAARMRSGAHPAIDYGGRIGDPVLAAADGTVRNAFSHPLCGNGVVLEHRGFNRYTLYCHMQETRVGIGDAVKRGQVIGLLGATGEPTARTPPGRDPIPQLHFELSDNPRPRNDGDLAGTYDPLKFTVGCFAPDKAYPTDRFALTHPVHCRDRN
ncbi:MAG TPA: M23 family metallopeptidase [Alphaproteobacteria bacterium]